MLPGEGAERKNRLHSINDDKMEDEEVFLRDLKAQKPDTHRSRIEGVGKDR